MILFFGPPCIFVHNVTQQRVYHLILWLVIVEISTVIMHPYKYTFARSLHMHIWHQSESFLQHVFGKENIMIMINYVPWSHILLCVVITMQNFPKLSMNHHSGIHQVKNIFASSIPPCTGNSICLQYISQMVLNWQLPKFKDAVDK